MMKKMLLLAIVVGLCLSTILVFPPFVKAAEAGLVGYWKFDEGSDTTANDSSGNGNTGALNNGPQWVTGVSGTSLRMDGVDDYVEVASNPSLSGFTQLTLEAWIKVDSLSMMKGYVVAKSDGIAHPNLNDEYGLFVNETMVDFHVANGGVDYLVFGTAPDVITEVGKWYYIVATWSGSAYAIYVNGVVASNGSAISGTSLVGSAPLTMGQIGHHSWTYFDGVIDEVKIYNYARTAEEIAADAAIRSLTLSPYTGFASTTVVGSRFSTTPELQSLGMERRYLLFRVLSSQMQLAALSQSCAFLLKPFPAFT